MSKISYFLPGKSWTDLYISMFAKTHKLRIYASSLHVFWIVSRILAAKPPINSGEKLTVDVDVFKAPCFARQEIHRKNPPICPSETQEIHRNPRSLLEFYHVFNHVLPEYHQFLLFFSTCLNIFLEQKFPSISPPLLWWCFPIFVHRFSLRKSIFSPFFHHFFTIFPGNPPKNAEKYQRKSPVVLSPRRKVHDLLGPAALREDGHRPLGVRALARCGLGDGRVEIVISSG